MTRALFAPAGEVGADTRRSIEQRVERAVVAIDFGGAAAPAERVDFALAPIVMDVREHRVGGAA